MAPLSIISSRSTDFTINQQKLYKEANRKESYQRGLCIYLAVRSGAPANNGYYLSISAQ